MKKYNEEIFSVYHKRTGKKIADCGSREDARMMVHMDPQNREYRVDNILMSPVIDIELPKALPTNEVVAVGSDYDHSVSTGNGPGQLPQIKLSEGQGEPVIV